MRNYSKNIGFTLVEMAIVLMIVGLLLKTLLTPLTAQRELRSIDSTQQSLKQIAEALNGFIILNNRLPCPSTQADPTNANYGLEDASCNTNYASEGYLPWKTLGVTETDAWGIRRTSVGSSWDGYWRYRIDRNFINSANFNSNILSTGAPWGLDSLRIQDSAGNDITSSTERPIAIVYSTGSDLKPNGQNVTFEATAGIYESDSITPGFDDLLIWINRPTVVSRMASAGKLP